MIARRYLALSIIAAGILLIIFVVGYSVLANAITHPEVAPLPGEIAGLSLGQYKTGRGAVEEINRLHRKEFPLTSGAVGQYGAQHQVTLWVSGVPMRLMTSWLLKDMREKIAEGNSPFTPIGEEQVRERTIYILEGLGQRHFYFASNNLLIWLAADTELAEQALAQALEYYP